MNEHDPRFTEYQNHGNYRDFKKLKGYTDKLSHTTHFVFSNGEKEVFAAGSFKEEALAKIFDRIDKFYSNKKVSNSLPL